MSKKREKSAYFISVFLLALVLAACGSSVDNIHISSDSQMVSTDSSDAIWVPSEDSEGNPGEDDSVLKQIEASLVYVVCKDRMGSGVIYKETENAYIILTAGHVISEDENSAHITFPDGTTVLGEIISNAKGRDLAFCRVEKPAGVHEPVVIEKTACDVLKSSDEVYASGQGYLVPATIYSGQVVAVNIFSEDLQKNVITTSAKCQPGMSGGGLFDAKGRFLGLIVAMTEEQEAVAIPYISILAESMLLGLE